jgi:predicted enzyme related to lactoylglutathione lyase
MTRAGAEIRRIVPNLHGARPIDVKAFYEDVIGLELGMDLGWVTTYVSTANPTAQLSVIDEDPTATVRPDISIEVEDVDAVHAAAVARGVEIVHPITDEPWGVRRFFLRDPNGAVLNVLSHR